MTQAFKRTTALKSKGGLPLTNLILGGSCALGTFYYAKSTLLINYYKDFMELHGNGGPVKPSERLNNIVHTVSQDVKEFTSEDTSINNFMTPGLDMLRAGTIGTFQGGIIGLPFYFDCDSIEEVSNQIMVKEENINGANEKNTKLYECFLLSEKAKKYGIAHEILHVNTLQVYFDTVLPIGVAYVLNAIGTHAIQSLRIFTYPMFLRGFFYISFFIFGVAFWKYLQMNLRNYYDSEIESSISTLGKEYLEGGVEYNNKAIERRSLQIEFKDQKLRILKAIEDICGFTPFNDIPLATKTMFFKAHLEIVNKEPVK